MAVFNFVLPLPSLLFSVKGIKLNGREEWRPKGRNKEFLLPTGPFPSMEIADPFYSMMERRANYSVSIRHIDFSLGLVSRPTVVVDGRPASCQSLRTKIYASYERSIFSPMQAAGRLPIPGNPCNRGEREREGERPLIF